MEEKDKANLEFLKDIIKEKCAKVSDSLNTYDIRKRKKIVIGIFFIGLIILLINVFLINSRSESINQKKIKKDKTENYNDSLEIAVKALESAFDEMSNDSVANDFNFKLEK